MKKHLFIFGLRWFLLGGPGFIMARLFFASMAKSSFVLLVIPGFY